jgi:hypothetical protein
MTEYELLSLQAQRVGNLVEILNNMYSGFAVYLTIITAYLVAAYVAGDKLTRPQAFIATVTYIFGAAVIVYSLVLNMEGLLTVRANVADTWLEYGKVERAQRNDVAELGLLRLLGPAWRTLMVLGIFAPLYFMWSVRHPKNE